ncbi:hypothetical protein NBRC116588_01890 [Pyruvatibacter sp. HU-CL02332]
MPFAIEEIDKRLADFIDARHSLNLHSYSLAADRETEGHPQIRAGPLTLYIGPYTDKGRMEVPCALHD